MQLEIDLQKHKPLFDIEIPRWFYFYRRINWSWWLIRVPMALIATPAAYGVGSFAGERLPPPWNILAGCAFEGAYLGAIAIADQQEDETNATSILWWCVNGFAVVASVLCNLLFFSGGTYARITLEVMTHAMPLPILGFFYGLLIHRITTENVKRLRVYYATYPYTCPQCPQRFKSRHARNAHMRNHQSSAS